MRIYPPNPVHPWLLPPPFFDTQTRSLPREPSGTPVQSRRVSLTLAGLGRLGVGCRNVVPWQLKGVCFQASYLIDCCPLAAASSRVSCCRWQSQQGKRARPPRQTSGSRSRLAPPRPRPVSCIAGSAGAPAGGAEASGSGGQAVITYSVLFRVRLAFAGIVLERVCPTIAKRASFHCAAAAEAPGARQVGGGVFARGSLDEKRSKRTRYPLLSPAPAR